MIMGESVAPITIVSFPQRNYLSILFSSETRTSSPNPFSSLPMQPMTHIEKLEIQSKLFMTKYRSEDQIRRFNQLHSILLVFRPLVVGEVIKHLSWPWSDNYSIDK